MKFAAGSKEMSREEADPIGDTGNGSENEFSTGDSLMSVGTGDHGFGQATFDPAPMSQMKMRTFLQIAMSSE